MNLFHPTPNPRSVFDAEFAKTQRITRVDLPEITIHSIDTRNPTLYRVNYTAKLINSHTDVQGGQIKANDLVAFLIKEGCEADKAFAVLKKFTKTVITDYLTENHI